MRNILSLFSVLTKNAEMKVPKEGKRGRIYTTIGIIAVSCIMIPCCIIVGTVSYFMTAALMVNNCAELGILAQLHIMSAFSVVFGMLVVFNILFFSSDREHLMPLPFKNHEILLAKFLYAYLAESVMEFLILISMFVGFHIAYGFSITGVITGIIGVLLIPMVPMAYCAIIGLVLLVVLRNVKNGKIFNYVSTITLLIFTILFIASFKDMGGINVENFVDSLKNNSNMFTNVLNKVFFTVPLLCKALADSASLINILLYILASIGVVGIMTIIGHFTYGQALYTIGQLGSADKKTTKKGIESTQKSVFASYVKKEFLVLFRTKAYNNNCVFINLLWPVALIIYIYYSHNKPGFAKLLSLFVTSNERSMVMLTIAAVLLAFIASAMNSLASTAFTREGQHLEIIKYIPVDYKLQLKAKGFITIILSYPALLLCDIIAVVTVKINPLWIIYYAIISFASLIITTMIGLYLDSSHPHSDWDDEYSALRGNLNTFFDMAIVMVLSLGICTAGFLLNYFAGFNTVLFHIFMMLVICIIAIFSFYCGKNATLKNMEEL